MHSRMVQLSTNPEDPVTEDMFYDNFVGEVAGYIGEADPDERDQDLDWIFPASAFEVDKKAGTVTIQNRMAYFKGRFAEWRREYDSLGGISLETFASPEIESKLFTLRMSCDNKFDVYITDGTGCYQTLDSWLRHTQDGSVWYIGAILDYQS